VALGPDSSLADLASWCDRQDHDLHEFIMVRQRIPMEDQSRRWVWAFYTLSDYNADDEQQPPVACFDASAPLAYRALAT